MFKFLKGILATVVTAGALIGLGVVLVKFGLAAATFTFFGGVGALFGFAKIREAMSGDRNSGADNDEAGDDETNEGAAPSNDVRPSPTVAPRQQLAANVDPNERLKARASIKPNNKRAYKLDSITKDRFVAVAVRDDKNQEILLLENQSQDSDSIDRYTLLTRSKKLQRKNGEPVLGWDIATIDAERAKKIMLVLASGNPTAEIRRTVDKIARQGTSEKRGHILGISKLGTAAKVVTILPFLFTGPAGRISNKKKFAAALENADTSELLEPQQEQAEVIASRVANVLSTKRYEALSAPIAPSVAIEEPRQAENPTPPPAATVAQHPPAAARVAAHPTRIARPLVPTA